MSTNAGQMQSHNSMSSWIESHQSLAIGGGIVLVLVIAGLFMKKSTTPTTTPNSMQDLSGLTGGLVYVPTSTTFTTINENSNNPVTTTTTTTSNGQDRDKTTTGNGQDRDKTCKPGYHFQSGVLGVAIVKGSYPITGGYCVPDTAIPVPGPRQPPPPVPIPPTKGKSLIWDQRYTIAGGETLSSIAARLTNQLRSAGMPGSTSISWNDLWAHNTTVITSVAAQHHNPIPGGPWNDIFPGETITVPRWA